MMHRPEDNKRDHRVLAAETIAAYNQDLPVPAPIDSDLRQYADISRAHYTSGLDRIGEVRRALRRIEARFPMHAEQVVAAFCAADLRRSTRQAQIHS